MKNIDFKELTPQLKAAIDVATKAHKGQTDKGGEDYILHPLRVMYSMETEQEMTVAVLHDVVEDTPVTLSDLAPFGIEVVDAVNAISRRKNEGYSAYLDRVAANKLALKVKLADLRDNMSPGRSWTPPASMMERYRNSVSYLQSFI